MEFLETNNLIGIAQKIKVRSLAVVQNLNDIKIYLDTRKNLEAQVESLKVEISKAVYENTELKNEKTREIAIKEAIVGSDKIQGLLLALKSLDSKINELEVKNLCEDIEIKFLKNLLRIADISVKVGI